MIRECHRPYRFQRKIGLDDLDTLLSHITQTADEYRRAIDECHSSVAAYSTESAFGKEISLVRYKGAPTRRDPSEALS